MRGAGPPRCRLAVLAVVGLVVVGAARAQAPTTPTDPLWEGTDVTPTVQQRGRARVVWEVEAATVTLHREGPPPGVVPTCEGPAGSLTVQGPTSEALADALERVCATLAEGAPSAVLVPTTAQTGGGPAVPPWRPTPWMAVGAVWWLLAGAVLVGSGRAVAWAGAAGLVRAVVSGPRVLMGLGYPYERMLLAGGVVAPGIQDGPGFQALYGALAPLLGRGPHTAQHANLLASAVAVGLVHRGVAWWTGRPATADLAAALLLIQPLALALAHTETQLGAVLVLQVGALVGLAGGGAAAASGADRRGATRWAPWLAAVGVGLMANTRSLQLLVAVPILGALALQRRRGPLAVAGVLVGLRAAELAALAWGPGLPTSGRFHRYTPEGLAAAIRHSPSSLVHLDPGVVPLWTVPLAGLGAWWVARGEAGPGRKAGRAAVGLLVAVWLLGVLPVLHMDRATDVLRFGLPGLGALSALGAVGLAGLWARGRAGGRALVGLALVGGLLAARSPGVGRAPWSAEHRAVMHTLDTLPADATVHFDPVWDFHGAFGQWVAWHGRSTWIAGPPAGGWSAGDLLWRGRATQWPGAWTVPCRTEPLGRTWTAPSPPQDVEPLGTTPLRMGLERVVDCRPVGGDGDGEAVPGGAGRGGAP